MPTALRLRIESEMSGSTRKNLREKDAKVILNDFKSKFRSGEEMFAPKPKVESVQVRDGELILVDGKSVILKKRGHLLPTLRFDTAIRRLSRVVVDMGAVSHICNGADVMAKGIRRVDGEFKEGDLVVVVDEKYGKGLAVGEALEDSASISEMGKGKAISNLHYVGDDVWGVMKAIG